MNKIKIIIADDHKMFATSLAMQLNEREELEVKEAVTDPGEIMEKIEKHKPEAILMDIRMGSYNGLELAKEIKIKRPDIKIILMSGYNISRLARESSADGFTSKEESIDSLVQTIKKVCIEQANVFPICQDKSLTNAEVKILNMISRDMTRKEISTELYISEKTVTNHITSILEKLQVRSRIGAIMKGIELGLIENE